ncbi:MAG: zinc-binding dehydrogenase [Clostridia bacterium]|nr:zinc-binding dehydrogenase [Clostridia bacterium]
MAGYTLAMFAKLGGAKTVTIFGRRQERANKALELGVDYAKISSQAYEEDKKYQVVFEATGNSEVYAKGLPFLEENGILAVYAVSVTPYKFDLSNVPTNHTVRIVAPQVKSAVDFVQGLMADGKIPMDKLLTHVWDFSQAEEAMWKVKNGEVIKGLVKIGEVEGN